MTKQVELPEVGHGAKVIQLYIDELPILRCGPPLSTNSSVRHATILEQVLLGYNLSFSRISLGFSDGPALEGDRYKVVGMGLCSNFGDFAYFSGDSLDYKIRIDKKHLEKIQPLIPETELNL